MIATIYARTKSTCFDRTPLHIFAPPLCCFVWPWRRETARQRERGLCVCVLCAARARARSAALAAAAAAALTHTHTQMHTHPTAPLSLRSSPLSLSNTTLDATHWAAAASARLRGRHLILIDLHAQAGRPQAPALLFSPSRRRTWTLCTPARARALHPLLLLQFSSSSRRRRAAGAHRAHTNTTPPPQ